MSTKCDECEHDLRGHAMMCSKYVPTKLKGYEVHKESIEKVLYEMIRAFRENNPYLAQSILLDYTGSIQAQQAVNRYQALIESGCANE